MKPEAHGGDLLRMAATAGRDPASLLDFSVNVRPEGPPEFIRAALFRAMTSLAAYPSPHAEEAMLAAARHHGMDASRFVFGSGSNELIHALARVLRKRGVPSVRVVEPAFSEYAIACRLAGIKAIPVWGGIIEKNQCVPTTDTGKDEAVPTRDLLDALTDAPEGSAVFLANPGNPSGLFRTPEECLRLMSSRSDLLWIIDEAFVEYAGTETEASVLQRLPKNGIVLRSLTKFHAVPGVRLGYLAADAELAQAIRDELPAWSVNAFALAAAQAVFADTSDFAAQTRAENAERRADLAAALSSLPGIEVYPSAANYVLFRWPGAPHNLLGILLKRFGIAVRDCSNYHGLKDGSWFRAAVRFPEDHRRLAEALSAIRETTHGVSSSPLPETPASPESGNKDSINIKVLGRGGMGARGKGGESFSPEKFLLPSPGGSTPHPAPAAQPVIRAVSLTKKFGTFVAAHDITFEVQPGRIFGLLGPNGAGKSTTFRMLCGLSRPTEGECFVAGMNLLTAGGAARAKLGYMAQKFSLYGELTVQQNMRLMADLYGLERGRVKPRIEQLVEALDLETFRDVRAFNLPLGQKQRLAMACATLHEPPVLFLDEPTSGVDPRTRREFWKHINAMTQNGVAVLVTTHFMEEAEYCDEIALVFQGGIIARGTPDELKGKAPGAAKNGGAADMTLEEAFIAYIEEVQRKGGHA